MTGPYRSTCPASTRHQPTRRDWPPTRRDWQAAGPPSSSATGPRRTAADGYRTKPAAAGLGWLNAAPGAAARAALSACCAADAWIARVSDGRPYPDEEALYAASGAATAALDDAGLRQALAAHPRIGDRAAGHGGAWTRQEQAAVAGAGDGLLAQLAAASAAYERRFRQVYLVCASGRGAAELLAVCRARLGNDPAAERAVVLGELARINQLRLRKLLNPERPG